MPPRSMHPSLRIEPLDESPEWEVVPGEGDANQPRTGRSFEKIQEEGKKNAVLAHPMHCQRIILCYGVLH